MNKSKKENNMIILKILMVMFIIIGIIVYLMPTISNWLYDENVKKIEYKYFEQIENEENNKYEKLYDELKNRNEYLYINKQKDLVDPFSYTQSSINLEDYGLQDNIIGFISIPKMDIEIPIYLGANKENMKKGAVHLTQTSYPIGGKNTNAVIAAHRGYSKAQLFRHIEKLQIGDEVYIHNFMETLLYKVCKIEIINPTDIQKLLIQNDKDLVTLLTCHPYRVNSHRYVVYCERTEN